VRCAETTAAELLALADHVATVPHPELRSAWARACAILARRALEAAVDAPWKQRTGDMPDRTQVSMRAKLLCLGEFVDDDVAEDRGVHVVVAVPSMPSPPVRAGAVWDRAAEPSRDGEEAGQLADGREHLISQPDLDGPA
jgi:hypothetical protein